MNKIFTTIFKQVIIFINGNYYIFTNGAQKDAFDFWQEFKCKLFKLIKYTSHICSNCNIDLRTEEWEMGYIITNLDEFKGSRNLTLLFDAYYEKNYSYNSLSY